MNDDTEPESMDEASFDEALTGSPEAQAARFPSLDELAAMLPQYEIHLVIGIGGMGAVYLARQLSLDRWVAIKVLPVVTDDELEDAERFIREARAMARLVHPHIAAVFDFGQTEAGHLYLVMEFIEGGDLHRRTRAGEVTPERARTVIAQLCEALQFAHAHGVVHRDIKPANILINKEWQVKVVDFGLARDLTGRSPADESEYGTPEYVAPERLVVGAEVDHRADIYSLGVVIHEMLTGLTPQAAGAAAGQGLPEGFAGVLSKCLMHDPARRYQSAAEVRTALLAAVTARTASTAPAPPPRRQPAPMPRHAVRPPVPTQDSSSLWSTLGWGLACVIMLGGLGWLIWHDQYQKSPAEVIASSAPATELAPTKPATVQVKPEAKAPTEEPMPSPPPAPEKPSVPAKVAMQPAAPLEVMKAEPVAMTPAPPVIPKAAPTAAAVVTVSYRGQILPIFRQRCYECHSETKGKVKGDLAMEPETMLQDHIGPGRHIIPGAPQKSTMLIFCKLPDDDEDVMPPKGKNRLTPAELTLLETWITEGASLTANAVGTAPAQTWSSSEGRAIEASFVAMQGDQVTLKMSATGTDFTFPLSRLSAESQAQAKAAAGQ